MLTKSQSEKSVLYAKLFLRKELREIEQALKEERSHTLVKLLKARQLELQTDLEEFEAIED